MLKINEYPAAIANQQNRSDTLEFQIRDIKSRIQQKEDNANYEVAIDPDLKNEAQRKNKAKLICQSDLEFLNLKDLLNTQEKEYRKELNHLTFLQNEFTVAKLQMRSQTARLESLL